MSIPLVSACFGGDTIPEFDHEVIKNWRRPAKLDLSKESFDLNRNAIGVAHLVSVDEDGQPAHVTLGIITQKNHRWRFEANKLFPEMDPTLTFSNTKLPGLGIWFPPGANRSDWIDAQATNWILAPSGKHSDPVDYARWEELRGQNFSVRFEVVPTGDMARMRVNIHAVPLAPTAFKALHRKTRGEGHPVIRVASIEAVLVPVAPEEILGIPTIPITLGDINEEFDSAQAVLRTRQFWLEPTEVLVTSGADWVDVVADRNSDGVDLAPSRHCWPSVTEGRRNEEKRGDEESEGENSSEMDNSGM